jgi:uncharacterized protein (TIGR02391 family)
MSTASTRYFTIGLLNPGGFETTLLSVIGCYSGTPTYAHLAVNKPLSDDFDETVDPAKFSDLRDVLDISQPGFSVRAWFEHSSEAGGQMHIGLHGDSEKGHVAVTVVARNAAIVNECFDRLVAGLGLEQTKSPLVKYLEQVQEDNQDQPEPATIVLSHLHPAVVAAAADLFASGHYRQAILDSYIALSEAVKSKAERPSLDGVGLMQTVFSRNNPILQISTDPDEQLGAMWLFSGAIMAVRNPRAHKLGVQPSREETFEWLAFVSALFRLVDTAEKQP